VIENHHTLFADFIEKSNIYHHLGQMTKNDYLNSFEKVLINAKNGMLAIVLDGADNLY